MNINGLIRKMTEQKLRNANRLGLTTIATQEELKEMETLIEHMKYVCSHMLVDEQNPKIQKLGVDIAALILIADVGFSSMQMLSELAERNAKLKAQAAMDNCENRGCVLKRSHQGECIY